MPSRTRAASAKRRVNSEVPASESAEAAPIHAGDVIVDSAPAAEPAAATNTSADNPATGKGKRRGRAAPVATAVAPHDVAAIPASDAPVAAPAAIPATLERSESDIRAAGLSLVARMFASAASGATAPNAAAELLRSVTSASSSAKVDASHPVLVTAMRSIAHDSLTTRALGDGVSARRSRRSSALPNGVTSGMIRYAHEDAGALPALNHVAADEPAPVRSAADRALQASAGTTVAADASATAPRVFSAAPRRVRPEDRTALGGKWFNMAAHTLTSEVKKDLLVLRNRAYMDPKRHYKTREEREGPLPRFFDVGVVQEAPHELFSQRLTKKERAPTLVDALLADEKFRQYAKKHSAAVAAQSVSGTKAAMKRARESAAPVPAWKREMNALNAMRPNKKRR